MQRGPARTRPQSEPAEENAPSAADWYAVTGDGGSALRIAPGLTAGESDSGALVLNDADPARRWIQFDLGAGGEPSVAVVTRDRSLMVGGSTRMRQRVGIGATIKLPNNTLHISRDIRMPPASGPVLEVVPREVPARPHDLVAPGWEEALEAVREPDAASPTEEEAEAPAAVMGEARTPREQEADARAEDGREESAVVGPRRAASRRRPRKQRNTLALAAAMSGLAVMTVAGVLLATDWLDDRGVIATDEPEVAIEPADAGARPDDGALPGSSDRPPEAATGVAEPEVASSAPAASTAGGGVEAPARPAPQAEDAVARDQAAEGGSPTPDHREEAREAVQAPAETDVPAQADVAGAGSPEPPPVPDWRLTRARELMEAGYITYPPQDNAVTYLERLLAEDPDNPEALALLEEASTRLVEAAVRAHDRGLDYQARNTLEEVFGFNPDSERASRLWREWVGTER